MKMLHAEKFTLNSVLKMTHLHYLLMLKDHEAELNNLL
jgi:hypothetical protein